MSTVISPDMCKVQRKRNDAARPCSACVHPVFADWKCTQRSGHPQLVGFTNNYHLRSITIYNHFGMVLALGGLGTWYRHPHLVTSPCIVFMIIHVYSLSEYTQSAWKSLLAWPKRKASGNQRKTNVDRLKTKPNQAFPAGQNGLLAVRVATCC